MSAVEVLAQQLSLGDLLAGVRALGGDLEILWHHTQGEFHHDLAVRVPEGRRCLAFSSWRRTATAA